MFRFEKAIAGVSVMRYISVCDGIGAAHVAWRPLDWKCCGVSEIDPYCIEVAWHHWRRLDVHRFVNFGRLDSYDTIARIAKENPDVIIGGTPCQSFSVAGKRGGLENNDGQLILWYLYAICRARPQYFVWENVPGVLSIDQGRVFQAFIESFAQIGYVVEWKILDAQYFGVPQRRRRVYVVGHLAGLGRGEILFETESRRRRVTKGEKTGKDDQRTVANCLRARGSLAHGAECDNYVCDTVTAKWAKGSGGPSGDECQNLVSETVIAKFARGATGNEGANIIAETLTANCRNYAKAGNNAGIVNPVIEGYRVRRITPLECERLMGFPDDYTYVPVKTHKNGNTVWSSDSQRYKALGNSMAVPVIRWIGERIMKHEKNQHE